MFRQPVQFDNYTVLNASGDPIATFRSSSISLAVLRVEKDYSDANELQCERIELAAYADPILNIKIGDPVTVGYFPWHRGSPKWWKGKK